MIITIDGPAGSGKSTVAKALAKRLGFRYIDTGAFYRAFTCKAMRAGADLEDEGNLCKLVKETDIRVEDGQEGIRVLVDGEDVTREIRDPAVTERVHFIASLARVREPLVERQRAAAEGAASGALAAADSEAAAGSPASCSAQPRSTQSRASAGSSRRSSSRRSFARCGRPAERLNRAMRRATSPVGRRPCAASRGHEPCERTRRESRGPGCG